MKHSVGRVIWRLVIRVFSGAAGGALFGWIFGGSLAGGGASTGWSVGRNLPAEQVASTAIWMGAVSFSLVAAFLPWLDRRPLASVVGAGFTALWMSGWAADMAAGEAMYLVLLAALGGAIAGWVGLPGIHSAAYDPL